MCIRDRFDGIEYRGFGQEIVEELAKHAGVPVWNGLTNESHPTQILADFLTIREQDVYKRQGEVCIASYMNFTIVNGGVIVPQYDDENDELALKQIAQMFPDRKVVGVSTKEVAYGGGNIHCITQQQPAPVVRG